jgi:hypothetical protein
MYVFSTASRLTVSPDIVCRSRHLNKLCHDGKEGVSAMKKTFIVFCISLLLTYFYGLPEMSQATPSSNLKAFYAAYIDDCIIIRCESLANLRNSRSEKLRQAAEMHCLMAQFFKTQKTALVDDMILADLGTKEYKIQYYLKGKFFEVYRNHSIPSNC